MTIVATSPRPPAIRPRGAASIGRAVVIGRALVVGMAALLAVGCSASASSGGAAPAAGPTATSCPGSSSGVTVPTIDAAGGRPSPIAAAEYFAKHGNVGGVPLTGWKVIVQTADGAFLRSGAAIIHVTRGSDGTWLVSGEHTCLS